MTAAFKTARGIELPLRRMHVRGTVGAREISTFNGFVSGDGQIRL